MNKQQTAITKLISTFKESIDYLESSLEDVTDETTRIRLRARLSQARYFLNYANEAKEIEKEQIIGSYLQGRMEGHNLPMSIDYVNLLDDAEGEALKYYKETYE
jgi:hypothetical protein